MLLSNVFSNRFDDFINTSNKKNVIKRCQTRNATSFWLLGIGKNRVASHFKIEKGALKKNGVAGHSKIEKRAIKKNGVAGYSER